jgi:hypothetical protein
MIKLLDGKNYDHKELLSKMDDDSFYYGELNRLALSSSSLKLLLSSPKTYKHVTKYGNPETQPLRDGWLFHTAILEPHVFNAQIFVDVASKKNKAEKLADAFFRNEHALKLITDCEFEVPAIGNVCGFPFRGKADVLGKDRIVDLKSTTDIKGFPYAAKKYGYDVQCYLYCSLFDVGYEQFKFLVMDKGSLDIGVWDCSEEFYLEGKRKVEKAVDIFETFFINGASLDDYVLTGTL